jgi:BirA family transcriptional regulator, biotin operon repressor / biotin---[acetyl-CoA-carboxylase] ligase
MNFTEGNLKAALSGKTIGEPLYFFPSVESTNHVAFNLAGAGAPEGTVIVADHQTRGRGRMQRAWLSPPATNLYISLILRPASTPPSSSFLTIMTGVAAAQLLTGYCPQQVQLKWPNDVLINNKKVCGILTEMKTTGKKVDYVIIGIGINLNMKKKDFPFPLASMGTSLQIETGTLVDRVEFTAKLLEILGVLYNLLNREGMQPLRELWLSYSQLVGKCVEITFAEEVYRGTVMGMDNSGALLVKGEKGRQHRVIAGDIKVIEG